MTNVTRPEILRIAGAILLWGGVHLAMGAFDVGRFLIVASFIFLTLLLAPRVRTAEGRFSAVGWGVVAVGLVCGGAYAWNQTTFAAWGLVGSGFVLGLGLPFAVGYPTGRRWAVWGAFAGVAVGVPVALELHETHFAEEEFFIAVEMLILTGFWGLLSVAATFKRPVSAPGRAYRWLAGLLIVEALGALWVARAYQRSFYPLTAPTFPGISAETPFVCGEVPPSETVYAGDAVFQALLARVERNPEKNVLDYALLAVGTGNPVWAADFRVSLLAEAEAGQFTHPANSVKYSQYLAGQRAYVYLTVRAAFPDLFSPADQQLLEAWFWAINRRAQTTEWIDVFYALALGQLPAGPYENQETGAGLLALLETGGLAAPELAAKNQAYLAENPRGWLARFRVTDDAAVYQPEWIANAWHQSQYAPSPDPATMRQSFDWLLRLALPDGAPLRINHLGAATVEKYALLGAALLDDGEYVWLAGRAGAWLDAQGSFSGVVPGMDLAPLQTGVSPTVGSCLLYGDSGLPTQVGPLAPDKLVFRSGWEPDDLYLLINLRFTGWHRYKATNSVTMLYQEGALVFEDLSGGTSRWLPEGRSQFRDRRIPRENLNGLLIPRTGMSAVLWTLTGFGSPWAQDPPYYAEVTQFEQAPGLDVSTSVIANWRGWRHARTVYFFHEGVVVIVDDAQGPANGDARLGWHLTGGITPDSERLALGAQTPARAEAVFLPLSAGSSSAFVPVSGEPNHVQALYLSPADGHLRTATVFLTQDWVGAWVTRTETGVQIMQGDQILEVILDE
ncbi:MAG: heparinase II/III family protein [Anaerolineales bacterium]|nr:heparinase II/III family protein [Anaerolineales bacterium]